MLAREKWQIATIKVLERVFDERCRQKVLHGDAMADLPDGIGPHAEWLPQIMPGIGAAEVQEILRGDYEQASYNGELTKMHIVREELAEAFELDGDDPEFLEEILQVAALCVQWAEIKIAEKEKS